MAEILHSAPHPNVFPSACPLDCPDACSLEVRVEDGRVVKVDGSHRNPITEGFICSKVRRLPEYLYGPERLLYPARRVGPKGSGEYERLSWDEALGLAVEKIRETRERWGGESILPFYYGGSNGVLTQDTTDARLFRRLGASRMARTVCAAATGRAATGLYGKMPGVAFQDFVHARLIVLWGVNPSASGIHQVPFIQEAQRAGARLVVVDPRRTPLAKQADLYLPLRPGSDLAVALSAIRWLFEEGQADLDFLAAHATGWEELRRRAEPWTFERAAEVSGVAAEDIERFVRLYAETSPAVIRCGWGLERNRNGGSAVASVLALPAVAGKFGVRGGGFVLSNSGAWSLDSAAAVAEPEASTRVINMNRLGETLLERDDPPVQVLFVYNCNPLATMPNQEKVRRGLAREDLFTIVFEQAWTDTARMADLVLPATHFMEHTEMSRGYGVYVLHRTPAVAAAAGEARPNPEVFAELIRRLELARPGEPETAEDLAAALLGRSERIRGELERDGIAHPDCGFAPIQFADSFPATPDHKVHLVPEALNREAPHGLYTFQEERANGHYPLALISPATNRTISSTFGQLVRKRIPLEIHPRDAEARGLSDGDTVRVWNDLGEVRVKARLNPDMRPGESDPDAAIYWLARMLASGEDPLYVARRMIRFASEDVGLADPQALPQALAAWDSYHRLGSPEGELALAQAVLYLALAPKSVAAYEGYKAARRTVEERPADPVPMAIRNAPTRLMKDVGYGAGYVYAPHTEEGVGGLDCLPESLQGTRFYEPKGEGFEAELKGRLERFRALRERVKQKGSNSG